MVRAGAAGSPDGYSEKLINGYYYVRKTREDKRSQKGGKACVERNPGCVVFYGDGNVVYGTVEKRPEDVEDHGNGTVEGEKKVAYRVRVRIPDLNIRKGPGRIMRRQGSLPALVCFQLWRRLQGKVLRNGGELRSRAGWISLEYGKKM